MAKFFPLSFTQLLRVCFVLDGQQKKNALREKIYGKYSIIRAYFSTTFFNVLLQKILKEIQHHECVSI